MNTIDLKMENDSEFYLRINEYDIINPKGIVVIAHGMCEHQGRYENFARYLNTQGFLVYTYDMRGHGKSINDNYPFGYFGKNGDKRLVDDLVSVINYAKSKNSLPLFLFAHSMGTITSRVFLQENSYLVDKVVLSGAPCYNVLTSVAIMLAKLLSLGKHEFDRSKLLTKLSLGEFNKGMKHIDNKDAWISYNVENVINYTNDPLCGFTFTNNGYLNLFKLTKKMHSTKLYNRVNSNLDILVVVGEDDPCVGGKKGLNSTVTTLVKAGFKNIKQEVFPNMLHEILNETDNQKVYERVLAFLND